MAFIYISGLSGEWRPESLHAQDTTDTFYLELQFNLGYTTPDLKRAFQVLTPLWVNSLAMEWVTFKEVLYTAVLENVFVVLEKMFIFWKGSVHFPWFLMIFKDKRKVNLPQVTKLPSNLHEFPENPPVSSHGGTVSSQLYFHHEKLLLHHGIDPQNENNITKRDELINGWHLPVFIRWMQNIRSLIIDCFAFPCLNWLSPLFLKYSIQ